MNRVARAAELIGQPVVTLDQATTAGEVRDVLIDPERSRLVGFTVRGTGLLGSPLVGILPAEGVQSIGRDAVMIATESSIIRGREGMQASLGQHQDIIGKEVVTDGGASLGEVTDIVLEVDGPSARVVGYEVARPDGQKLMVPISGGVPLSRDALVLPAESEQRAVTGVNQLRQSVEHGRPETPHDRSSTRVVKK